MAGLGGGFLDAASGAPLHPVAREAMLAALEDGWADPDRLYGAGRRARLLLDVAREAIADAIGARADEVSFAANGTQAMHAAVLGAALGRPSAQRAIVHSAVEHSAVFAAVAQHVDTGGRAQSAPVDRYARIDVATFVAAARLPDVGVAVLQAANHEVGTTQPVVEVAAALPETTLVVDGTHAIGHIEPPSAWGVLAADARMWGGPTLGVLAVHTGTRWRSPSPADEREAGRVAGVPNVPAVVAAAAALRAVDAERVELAARHRDLVDRIRQTVRDRIPDVDILGDPIDRLPHIVTFSCLYVDGEALLTALDRRGFAVSSGSSCTSSALEPSHVLVAMGGLTSGNVRVSLHRDTTEAEVEQFLHVLPEVVAEVRDELGAAGL